MLDIKTLETWLWDAACSICGAVDAPKFKDYILPLIFIKRIQMSLKMSLNACVMSSAMKRSLMI